MTILVCGGAGYIGSHLCWLLADQAEPFVVLDNLSTGREFAVPPDGELFVGDVGDQELVAKIVKEQKVSAVIHFAGSIIVPESVSDPLKYYKNNTANSRDLIESCIENGVKHFIFSSTATVYGVPKENPVTEDFPLAPFNPYGTSKVMTEMMLKDVSAAHDFDYVALRYFNVAGADPKKRTGQSTPDATHLIKVANQVALGQREKLAIFGTDYDTPDGTCIRDYIHVSDLAAAHLSAINYLRDGGTSVALNCGYGKGFSVKDVVEALEKIIGRPLPTEMAPRRAGDIAEIIADNKKIKALLGWQPQYDDLSGIIENALEWERRLALKNSEN
jgi:UDP-glucose 4-epimerase